MLAALFYGDICFMQQYFVHQPLASWLGFSAITID